MTQMGRSTVLTPVSNKPFSEQSLSELGVTERGTLSPEKWKKLHTGFLYMAAIGDYAAEMCKAMASRARELANETQAAIDSDAHAPPENDTSK